MPPTAPPRRCRPRRSCAKVLEAPGPGASDRRRPLRHCRRDGAGLHPTDKRAGRPHRGRCASPTRLDRPPIGSGAAELTGDRSGTCPYTSCERRAPAGPRRSLCARTVSPWCPLHEGRRTSAALGHAADRLARSDPPYPSGIRATLARISAQATGGHVRLPHEDLRDAADLPCSTTVPVTSDVHDHRGHASDDRRI